jgi:hypothetical protein
MTFLYVMLSRHGVIQDQPVVRFLFFLGTRLRFEYGLLSIVILIKEFTNQDTYTSLFYRSPL